MNSLRKAQICLAVAIVALMLTACASSGPEVVMSKGPDNPIVMKMKHDIMAGNPNPPSNSWLWWYAPVAGIAVMWAVKYLFFRKCVEESIDALDAEEPKKEENTKP